MSIQVIIFRIRKCTKTCLCDYQLRAQTDLFYLEESCVDFRLVHNHFNLSAAGVEQNNSDLLN